MQSLLIMLAIAVLTPVPGGISPDLADVLQNTAPAEKILVIVHMNTEYPYAQIQGLSAQEKCQVFKTVAMNSQTAIVDYVRSLPAAKAQLGGQFWIFNGFHLLATPDVIRALASRDDVWFICSNATIQLDFNMGEDADPPRTPEWNISKICADSCWNAGFTGAGIILGHVDTGVLTTHEALTGKWLSPYWIDGVAFQATPYDDHGHGTHTMGTICGGDGPGPFVNDVGIAYGCQFIPTKAFTSGGSGTNATIDTCMNYLANLKAGGVDIRAIGNSWGNNNGQELHWWSIVLNWQAIGVLPVFSNGNAGPGAGTVGSPGSYPMSIGIGSTNSSDAVSGYSSRGPAPNIDPINNPIYWYYSAWNLLKPDVSAPGENVRSSYNTGGYTSMSGTSMASPHVTGGTAVLLQKNPALTVTDLYDLFRNYCDQPAGYTYPNNDYGWGRINLWRSLQNVPMSNRPCVVLNRTAIVNDNNGNGKLDPGENAGITSYIKNTGGVTATNVNGTLRTPSSYVTILDSLYSYGTLATGDSANNAADPYEITINAATPPGTVVNFNLVLVAAETTWVRPFSYVVGTAPGTIIWGPRPAPGFPAGGFIYGIAYDRTGDQIFVTDGWGRSIYRYSSDSFVTYYGSYAAPDTGCDDICYVRATDQLYVTSYMQKQVWKLNKTTGAVIRQFANPAIDYPIGLVYRPPNTMWFADRRTTLGNPGYIYIGDTLGVATQYPSPVVGYYNTRCLAYDSLGATLLHTQTWFNSGGTAVDSVGLVEMTTAAPPALTGRRMLLNVGWNLRGIEFDPRDGNYWITIPQLNLVYVQDIVKIRGFYAPSFAVKENKEPIETQELGLIVSPNPAIRRVAFNLRIPEVTNVTLTLFDALGRKVVQLIDNEHFNAGSFTLNWNRQDYGHNEIADGVYFITLHTDQQTITAKLILTR